MVTILRVEKVDQDEVVEFDGISNQREFIVAEHAYIREKYGEAGVDFKTVIYWLSRFITDTAEVVMFDGSTELITFLFPKHYHDLPEN